MISLQQIRLQLGPRVLLENATFTLYEGQKIGIVGANGSGKTSLFRLILGELSADKGEIQRAGSCKIAHLAQEIPALTQTALDYVCEGDELWLQIQQEIKQAEETDDHHKLGDLYIKMQDIDGYTLPSRAAEVLNGLGFSPEEIHHTVASFSGGWRMRLNLARVLMSRANLLMLDEPTNHLDLEAILWLEKWLASCQVAILVISHDRDFLDGVVTQIVNIENQTLKLYKGNYSTFEETRAMQLALQQAAFQKQQAKIEHAMKFVNRFKAKASKAKQAQSRLKMVERMEKVAAVHMDSPFHFAFRESENKSNPLLVVESGQVAYADKVVLDHINLSILAEERIGVLGLNGAGKSTLLKTLAGRLTLTKGIYQPATNLRIGYFAQHQVDELVLGNSPLQHFRLLDSQATEQSLRTFLGTYNFVGDQALSPIEHFSGGEKARLALALLAWKKPDLLLLDEPTNHLDMEVREALVEALLAYNGAMLVVSHDRYLLRACVDEFLLVSDQSVKKFEGDLDDYQNLRLDVERKKKALKPSSSMQAKDSCRENNKEKKKLLARLNEVETRQAKLQEREKVLLLELEDQALYLSEHQEKLTLLLSEKQILEKEKEQLDEEWFLLSEQISG